MKNFVQKLSGLDSKATALHFVLMFGVISLFADFTYEGSRSIVGPYLAQLGASGTAVGIIAGLGELLGYALRLVSGRVAEKTGAFWPITLFGYAVQMISVPLLACGDTVLPGCRPSPSCLTISSRGTSCTEPERSAVGEAGRERLGVRQQGPLLRLHEVRERKSGLLSRRTQPPRLFCRASCGCWGRSGAGPCAAGAAL